MANMPSIANMYKKYFCMEDNSDCARYMMVKAGLPIPPDLFPNMNKKAEEIIASRRR